MAESLVKTNKKIPSLNANKSNQHQEKKIFFKQTNKIFHSDAVSLMQEWPDDIFDACITDPPYNIAKQNKGLSWAFSSHVTMSSTWDRFEKDDYETFTENWLKEICRVTKKNGNIFIFGSFHNIFLIGYLAQKLNLRIINNIIWAKPNAQPNITCRMFTESTEQILWICNNPEKKATNWTFNYQKMKELNQGKQMRNFWIIPTTPMSEKVNGKHPSQKPIALMERIVLAASKENDLILDCFCGSGSTLVACKKNNRNFIGIENNQEYIDLALKRLESF